MRHEHLLFDISDADSRIERSKIANGIHSYCQRIFCQNFLGWNIERDCSQIYFDDVIDARQYEEEARTFGSSCYITTQSKYYSSFIFLNNFD